MVCPQPLRSIIIWEAHRMYHGGSKLNLGRVQQDWWWPGLQEDFRRLPRTCKLFQTANRGATANNGQGWHLTTGSWQLLSIDLVDPFTSTKQGNTTFLVLPDYLTRLRYSIQLPKSTAEVVAEALEHLVFCYRGFQKEPLRLRYTV